MKTKNKIKIQSKKKSNSELVETINSAKKNKNWAKVASILSGPRKNYSQANLKDIEKESGNETIIIPGKVLSEGEINKKVKIAALNFSSKAQEKLLKSKCEILSINEEIKKNPEGKNIKVLRK